MGVDEYEAAKKAVKDTQANLDDANIRPLLLHTCHLDQAKAAEASARHEISRPV